MNASSDDSDIGGGDGGNLNVPLPTLGGKQFWTDFRWRNGWRVQQNALTKHWRLLDEHNIRRAWGNKQACLDALELEQPENSVQNAETYLVLVHGLMRSAGSFQSLADFAESELNVRSVRFEYASTRQPIADHAAALREVIEHLPRNARIAFCAHSMGNIVIRHAIADWNASGDPTGVIPRMHAFVMLGPPNHGAAIARNLSRLGLFELITGKGGMELGPDWEHLETRLATPPCPFAIVAGRLESSLLQNPLVGATGDFIVSVDETRLEGATDFIELPVLHSTILTNKTVQEAVVHFMRTGQLRR